MSADVPCDSGASNDEIAVLVVGAGPTGLTLACQLARVGYAPFPNEVIDRIQRDAIPTIMGNYDDGMGFDRDECGCAYRDPEDQRLGDLSLMWTRKTVPAELKAFLRSLHPEIRFEADAKPFRLVHGSQRRMNEYLFEDRPLSSFTAGRQQ
jgi:hypothetical protein